MTCEQRRIQHLENENRKMRQALEGMAKELQKPKMVFDLFFLDPDRHARTAFKVMADIDNPET